MVARLARLVAIAGELGEAQEIYFGDMLMRLKKRLEVWLERDSATPFVYDESWGGLISCGCTYFDCGGLCTPRCTNLVNPPESCPALANTGMNFGNSVYNDHHFHYG